jgi:hypothetical protein
VYDKIESLYNTLSSTNYIGISKDFSKIRVPIQYSNFATGGTSPTKTSTGIFSSVLGTADFSQTTIIPKIGTNVFS